MSRFYRIKEICITLGISHMTLYRNIERGKWPQLEHPNPSSSRVSGYSECTYKKLLSKLLQSVKQHDTM